MTNFIDHPHADAIVRLTGEIKNYRCTRAFASFVFTESSQRQLGIVAVAAAAVGMSGQAASTVGSASDVEEAADYLEFDLGAHHIKGWVWRSPFRNGDNVTIAAQHQGEYYEVYGIARPADKTIALYPHCSRSKERHIRNAVKWWAISNVLFFGFISTFMLYAAGTKFFYDSAALWLCGVTMALIILMFASLTRQFMPFVRVAQKVFVVIGLPNPKNIDLVKSSNQQRTKKDTAEFGTFYFRY